MAVDGLVHSLSSPCGDRRNTKWMSVVIPRVKINFDGSSRYWGIVGGGTMMDSSIRQLMAYFGNL